MLSPIYLLSLLKFVNVCENWLADDQVLDMSAPVRSNEASIYWLDLCKFVSTFADQGMYNNFASEHAFWADTTNMDNLRGADSTSKATQGAMKVSAVPDGVSGSVNTRHTYSGDEIHWIYIDPSASVFHNIVDTDVTP